MFYEDKQMLEHIINEISNKTYDDLDKCIDEMMKIHHRYISKFIIAKEREGLSTKTIEKYEKYLDFFAIGYLTYYCTNHIFNGYQQFDDFFGYYCIYKMGISKTFIIECVPVLKKFYNFLYQQGYINKEANDFAELYLKDGKEHWLEELSDFDNGIYNDFGLNEMDED